MTQTSIRIGGYRENRRERAHVKEETRCIPFFPVRVRLQISRRRKPFRGFDRRRMLPIKPLARPAGYGDRASLGIGCRTAVAE